MKSDRFKRKTFLFVNLIVFLPLWRAFTKLAISTDQKQIEKLFPQEFTSQCYLKTIFCLTEKRSHLYCFITLQADFLLSLYFYKQDISDMSQNGFRTYENISTLKL